MSVLDCPLTDAELIEAVMTMNAELARTGAKTWRMHIPVDLRRDSDILIAEIARRFRDQLTAKDAEVTRLREALQEFGKHHGRCNSRPQDWNGGVRGKCDCGLDEAVAKG